MIKVKIPESRSNRVWKLPGEEHERDEIKKEDKYLKGIYCDVDMTLIDPFSKVINEKLLSQLVILSQENEVVLWTGGDPNEAKKNLLELGISKFPVLSKYDFKGCIAEHVIDDASQEDFERGYKIKAQNYQEINYEEWIKDIEGGLE